MYHDPQYGQDVRKLELSGIASTVLHSYANALGPCPCGCRLTAFHPMTLRKGGLRGYYVLSRTSGCPRHLHPREIGLLLGLPDSVQYPQDLRTSLALLGLIASPLQVIWIYGHLLLNHSWSHPPALRAPFPAVTDWLWAYTQELLAQISFDSGAEDTMSRSLELRAFGASLNLSIQHFGAKAAQLLRAERISLGWNESCHLQVDEQLIGRAAALIDHADVGLDLLSQQGPAGRVQPLRPVVIAVKHHHVFLVHFAQPGIFLFEVLTALGLPLIRRVLDVRGRVLPVDLRIWHPLSVETLDFPPWNQPVGYFRCGNGPLHVSSPGLHDGHIWTCIHTLLQETNHEAKSALVIHPAFAAALQDRWISTPHAQHLKTAFEASSGHILCIFETQGHWLLLWGERIAETFQWTCYDGFDDTSRSAPTALASTISSLLGLDFRPLQLRCHVPQLDPFTCGTIALVHLFHLLHPGLRVPASSICSVHQWILAQPSLTGSIFATGRFSGTFSDWGPPQLSAGLHDGQIWHGLLTLLHQSFHRTSSIVVLHPLVASRTLLDSCNLPIWQLDGAYCDGEQGDVFCIFAADGHWTLLHGHISAHTASWVTYGGSISSRHQAQTLISCFARQLGLDLCPCRHDLGLPQLEPHTCGTIALANLWQILHPGLTVSPHAISHIHDQLLSIQSLPGHLQALGLTTLSSEQRAKLTTLLIDHGVPESKASDRTDLIIQKLGVPAILAAFVAKNNWAALKQQANKPGLTLRLVLPDELARQKRQDKVALSTPHFDPEALILQPGSFKDSDGDEVPQIALSQLEAEAHGIVIVTRQQGAQWLQQQDSISTNPLAVLVTEELPPEVLATTGATAVSFPATYKGTGEPVLIFGAMKNLGDQKINRHVAGNLTQIDIIENVVIRLHVYRDELQSSWSDLLQSPVRLLQQMLPPLQLCAGAGCGADCPKTHQPVGEHLDAIIMEVWGRSFGKVEGGRAPAPDATYFSVFLRIPASVLRPLLQTSIAGVYVDPRKDQNPDDRFRVIWLPSHSASEASHANKTCAKALGLVRLRQKYGIRVAAEDEESVFKILKPDATFIATRVQRTFQLFPLPHGLQRAGLMKILADFKWIAKPLQPGRGQKDGISWQVGSSDPPPATIFTSFGKEVLITETTKAPAAPRPVNFLASSRTQRHMRSELATASGSTSSAVRHTASGMDPWLEPTSDPWRTWQPSSTAAPPAKAASGKSHLAEVKSQLRAELQESMRKELAEINQKADDTMAADFDSNHEDRFRKLETTMEEIQAQQGQFSQWFTQVGQASAATESAIQTIQYTLSTHQQELHGLHQEIQTVSDNVSSTLQKTLATHQSEISSDFAARFDKLEAMFAKKQRSE
eukprot:s90_g47.t1